MMVVFLWGQMVGMIFICKNIHLSTNNFVSTIFNHSITECFISYESIMDTLEELLLALLLQLVGRIIFLVSRLLTISMSVRSSFLDALVEEHVDLGGSQFSESILERWYFARVSQRNVVVLEF